MHFRTTAVFAALLGLAHPGAEAQTPKPAGRDVTPGSLETRTVQVDVIVTDKKGEPVRDLDPTEFHLWEDNKEQTIRSVSYPSSTTASPGLPMHLVLFFGRIPAEDQTYARDAAVRFIEANAAPNRPIAILNYLGSGGAKVVQSFTADRERLMLAAKNMEASGVLTSNAATGVGGVMSSTYSDPDKTGTSVAFDVRSHLLALEGVAKSVASLPGRKVIVVLAPTINYDVRPRSDPSSVGGVMPASGVQPPAAPDVQYYVQPEDLAPAIAVFNKAKVTIYLVDVRVDHTPVQNQLGPLAAATGGVAIDNSKDALDALRRIAQDHAVGGDCRGELEIRGGFPEFP